MLEKLWIDHN